MLTLSPEEGRVLGVLIEKAQTTPGQYPLTVNAVIAGANQRSNREPVLTMTEDDVLDALDGLRSKSLVREVMLSGSRVEKHRHIARETLEVSTSELVVLAELMLRGPQTVGELRGRASRMHPLESIEAVDAMLEHLSERSEPFIVRIAPVPGSRAARFAQLLCPGAHPPEAAAPAPTPATRQTHPAGGGPAGDSALTQRVSRLETQVETLSASVRRLAAALGEPMGDA